MLRGILVAVAWLLGASAGAHGQSSHPHPVPPVHSQWLKLNGIHPKADEMCRRMTNLPGGPMAHIPGTRDYEACLGMVYTMNRSRMPPRPFKKLGNYPPHLF
jgi:hypothetical protein